ncbi:PDZ and LIM domain protein 4-like [Melitaea cinxia]|uniref:PDZ and LIM domain protein 4-like n=1 Tax=Melitaea cinxia TaxID=113334 RepID=UPI001E26F4E9|nr:PDZ and LIM domain protein 4-like [Melitaea cinxia]
MSAREVELTGGAPWGFRMHGGADQNQPLRISRVNPGRKASLSGIREGDVITSINGNQTKDMSNADAHAMLRAAGPVLRLGLNEDRELSPRRRSIGKSSELKRPSQLISEINSGRATPQAPVYATIRPPQSPHNKLSSPIRSLNSPLSTLNSTPLVKSIAPSEELPKFHPTNPFYSTLPNYTSASKLPIPNGKTANAQSSLYNRSNNRSTDSYNKNSEHDLKLSSFFSKKFDSGPSSIPNTNYDDYKSFETTSPKSITNDKYNSLTDGHVKSSEFNINISKEDKNPFETVTGEHLRMGRNNCIIQKVTVTFVLTKK